MNKEFVPYEIALELKQLGFDEYCIAYYNEIEIRRTGEIILHYTKRGQDLKEFREAERCHSEYKRYLKEEHCISKIKGIDSVTTLAPTYSQCFRWFREKYGLLGVPQYFTEGFYCFTINDMKDTPESNGLFTEFYTYEEAEKACLVELIKKIVKEK
jgi:hypothetical protein